MAMIEWNDGFSVGVAKIDRQHQKLFSMINELSEAMKQGKGKTVLEKVLGNLIDYTASHFQTEEKYFAMYSYPETSSHSKEHLAFVQKVLLFKDGFAKGKMSITVELMNFLGDWIRQHINQSDKKYSHFFKEKGLQ